MPSPIGGSSGMDAIGNLLAGAGGGGAPPVSAPGAPPGQDPAAAAADAQQQQLTQAMSQIRDFGEMAKQLQASYPVLAEDVQQILQLCKQMVVKVASTGMMQTGSSMAVPGNGGGV